MSVATIHLGSCCGLLEAFLVEYDQRISQEQAYILVHAHECKFCRISFAELVKKSQTPIFMEDGRGVVHELCSDCANMLFETDPGANEIDLSRLEGDVRKVIFGIMVGELRYARFKGESRAQAISPTPQQNGNGQKQKPGFVRHHPARHRMAITTKRWKN